MTRVLLAILVAAGVALTSGACGLFAQPPVVAMVSGRDDHGLLERPAIGLQRSPTDPTIVGTVHDGDFVKVARRDGPWAYVVLVGGAAEGWINDHDLRGEAVRAGTPPRRVRFLEAEPGTGGSLVRVRHIDDGSVEWVPSSDLKEVGAR